MIDYRKFYAQGAKACAVAGIAGVLTFAGAAMAQEISDSHLAVARTAVAASQSTQSLDAILPEIAERAKQGLIANRPDQADKVSQIVDEVALALAARRGDLEVEVARGYARIFNEEELKEIGDFYNSEAGKKLIRETPVVARMIEQAAQVWRTGIQRDLQQEVSKKITEAGL